MNVEQKPRRRRLPAEVLTAGEVHALMAACSNRAPTGVRNRALVAVLWRAGLRLGETLELRPKDLDAVRGTVAILHGKGDKSRIVGMDPQAFAMVEQWLQARGRLGIGPRAPVFCTLAGGELKQAYVRALLPRLARKAGVTKRVHAHGLRHTHAHELANELKPAHLIRDQLGHSSLATTDRYLRRLGSKELIDAMRSRPTPDQRGASPAAQPRQQLVDALVELDDSSVARLLAALQQRDANGLG